MSYNFICFNESIDIVDRYVDLGLTLSEHLDYNIMTKSVAQSARNNRLPVELGRWYSTPINERKCSQCDDIGDEYHYLLKCPQFYDIRKIYIKSYYYNRPNMIKFTQLLASENIPELKHLSCFVEKIMKTVNTS